MGTKEFQTQLETQVDADLEAQRRHYILKQIMQNGNATLEDLLNVVQNSKLGDVVKTITVDEIRAFGNDTEDTTETEPTTRRAAKKSAKTRGRKTGTKKATRKTTKKATKKSSTGKAKKSGTKKSGTKKDAAGRNARIDYNALIPEVVAFMRTKQGKTNSPDVQETFDISGPQARKLWSLMEEEGQVIRHGKGKYTHYELAS